MASPQASPNTPEKPSQTKQDGPRFIWITNNADGAMGLAMRPKRQPGSNTLSSPLTIHLPPGATVVDRGMWEQWKEEQETSQEHNEAQRLLKSKIPKDPFRSRTSERAGQPWLVEGPMVKNRDRPFDGLSDEEAIALAGEVQSDHFLRQLLAVEKRGPVHEAIQREITNLTRGQRDPNVA